MPATLWAVLAAGCITNPVQPLQPALGQRFELRAGAPALLQGGLTIVFVNVESDSRCPIDAVCIQAGDATVKLTLSHPSASRVERDLHTDRSGASVTYLSYTIALAQLGPAPRASQTTRPNDYVATLVVTMR